MFIGLSGSGMRTIELFSALPAITRPVILTGPGAGKLTVKRSSVPGTPAFRIFAFQDNDDGNLTDVTLSGMTITNGLASRGAGIWHLAHSLTLDGVHVTGNRGSGNNGTGSGAGIYSLSNLAIQNSTISNNVGQNPDYMFDGGGITPPPTTHVAVRVFRW